MLRGRIGFYRDEFLTLLGGYNEELDGYGHDDHDIMHRAWGLGMRMCWFGGQYHDQVVNKKHRTDNYKNRDWKYTENKNKMISYLNLAMGRFKANRGKPWGVGTVVKNFEEEIVVT
jgi:hypothetical protein